MNSKDVSQRGLAAGILVGVDELGFSDDAVRMGLELAARFETRVDLIHAVPTPPYAWPGLDAMRGAALTAELLIGARLKVDGHVRSLVRQRAAEESASVDAGSAAATAVAELPLEGLVRIVPGQPAQVLLDEARRSGMGLIVLGRHRRRDTLDFGNTARAVFAKSTVPVWVQPCAARPIAVILAPVDLSADSLQALATACSLARSCDARVRCVHCLAPASAWFPPRPGADGFAPELSLGGLRRREREQFEAAMQAFDWRGVEHTIECVEGAPDESILRLGRGSDLIVLGTHGRTRLASVVLGGTAYSVLKRSETPVLADRAAGRRYLLEP
jgi:universal stress protein A